MTTDNPSEKKHLPLLPVIFAIVLLIILAVMLIPLGRNRHVNARSNCMGQLRQIALAFKAYAEDNPDHYFPWAGGAGKHSDVDVFGPLLMPGYVVDARLFHCPDSKVTTAASKESDLVAGGHCDYSCVAGRTAAERLKDDGSPDTPILADNQSTPGILPHVGGYNVFFADGHGAWHSGTTTFQFQGGKKIWLNPK